MPPGKLVVRIAASWELPLSIAAAGNVTRPRRGWRLIWTWAASGRQLQQAWGSMDPSNIEHYQVPWMCVRPCALLLLLLLALLCSSPVPCCSPLSCFRKSPQQFMKLHLPGPAPPFVNN